MTKLKISNNIVGNKKEIERLLNTRKSIVIKLESIETSPLLQIKIIMN